MSASPRVVALGGGHGLAASLRALRLVTGQLTAIVTVADDGGSSGRLRDEIGALPPGDLRMALTSLAGADPHSQTWAKLLQHRFRSTGPLDGHAVGNVVLAGLEQLVGDPVTALRLVGELVSSAGCVLPMSVEPLDIVADVVGLDAADPGAVVEVQGQVAVATTPGRVIGVRLVPQQPAACPDALTAVKQADWVVFGPGSWFTSVLPHLLVPDLAASLLDTAGRRLVVLNLVPQPGETSGFSPETHLEVLAAHAPDLRLDVVLADSSAVTDVDPLRLTAEALGAELVIAPVSAEGPAPVHHPQRLAAAYRTIMCSDSQQAPGSE
ncbi:MAG: uridine diphosphate-N-acetylglucosamine-binding protein YvcK [Actinomycetes bacterium]